MSANAKTTSSLKASAEDKLHAAAEARRERQQLAHVVAEKSARARTAGAAPSGGEAERLVAEYQAKGGQVTVLPPVIENPDSDKQTTREVHSKEVTD